MKDRNTSKHLCLCFGLLPMLNIYQFIFYNFLHLCFQRIHQPHPLHRVAGFQFLGNSRRLHHAGQHGVHALPRGLSKSRWRQIAPTGSFFAAVRRSGYRAASSRRASFFSPRRMLSHTRRRSAPSIRAISATVMPR